MHFSWLFWYREIEKSSQKPDNESTVDGQEQLCHVELRIGALGSHSSQVYYHAATSTVQSCATQVEHTRYVQATFLNSLKESGMNEFMMDDIIFVEEGDYFILTMNFRRRLFLGHRNFQKGWILVQKVMKFPLVSIHFVFWSSVSMCGTNWNWSYTH